MYHLKNIPSLPADPRIARDLQRDTFVDEATVHSLTQRQHQWQEQRYFGEDFAGRDDCLWNRDESIALPMRHEVGAFFVPPQIDQELATPSPALQPTSESKKLWRHSLAVAAASVVFLATAAAGLWAAHAFAPRAESRQPAAQDINTWAAHDSAGNAQAELIVIDNRR